MKTGDLVKYILPTWEVKVDLGIGIIVNVPENLPCYEVLWETGDVMPHSGKRLEVISGSR